MRVGVVASWASAARLRSVLLQVQQRVMDRLVLAFERPPPHPLAVLEKDAPELRYFLLVYLSFLGAVKPFVLSGL